MESRLNTARVVQQGAQCSGTIFLIDDDPLWHHSVGSLLANAGLEVLHAFDYSDAIHQLPRLPSPLTLAIVDLHLPSSVPQPLHEGFHVLTALRQHGLYAIVLSAFLRDSSTWLGQHPEVLDVVDKTRFADGGFSAFFVEKIQKALAATTAARQAEGKMSDQQNRLRELLLDPPHPHE